MKAIRYRELMRDRWDDFVLRTHSGTFLHTRKYLSYHGNRLEDISIVLEDDRGQMIGILPAAVDPLNRERAVNHPGITYGGILHAGSLRGETMLTAFDAIIQLLASFGMERLAYKAVPYIYHNSPCSDDLYALFRLGAVRYRSDLSCTIDLQRRGPCTSRRTRGIEKAQRNGVSIREGREFASHIWPILTENLQRKHNLRPVHTVDEILLLHDRFPNNIAFLSAFIGTQAVAGLTLYETTLVSHAQYICSSPEGNELSALDLLIEHAIRRAQTSAKRYFDFGVSTVESGQKLNTGLHNFKAEFGGGAIVHDFFEVQFK